MPNDVEMDSLTMRLYESASAPRAHSSNAKSLPNYSENEKKTFAAARSGLFRPLVLQCTHWHVGATGCEVGARRLKEEQDWLERRRDHRGSENVAYIQK